MKGSILITDSLFIFPEHEKQLRDAGYEIERLDKPHATEEELIEHIKGKEGYILGGIEEVTEKVIDAADKLKAIVFSGIGYKHFIPAHEYATKKGIAIANAPDGPTQAVAEWSLAVALAMNRGLFELGGPGQKEFLTTKGLENQRIGIVGLGRIGGRIAEMIKVFNPAVVQYWSKHRHEESEHSLGIVYKELYNTLVDSDVVFLCVSKDAGERFFGKKELQQIKTGALLVSFVGSEIIDEAALLSELQSGRIRAASDNPMQNKEFKKLSLSVYYSFNGSNAFNTPTELKLTSDMATQSIINLLQTGQDQYRVN